MAKVVVMDEMHVTVIAPIGRSAQFYARVRRALVAGRFLSRLRKSARDVATADRRLVGVRIVVSR